MGYVMPVRSVAQIVQGPDASVQAALEYACRCLNFPPFEEQASSTMKRKYPKRGFTKVPFFLWIKLLPASFSYAYLYQ